MVTTSHTIDVLKDSDNPNPILVYIRKRGEDLEICLSDPDRTIILPFRDLSRLIKMEESLDAMGNKSREFDANDD